MRRQPDETTNGTSRRAPVAELSVSCCRCDALHRPTTEDAFHPLCERCARDGRALELGTRRFHALSDGSIAGAVGETSPGNFALGYLDGADFTVFYVGRSDSDVSASLHAWVDAPSCPPRRRAAPHAPWHVGTRALGPTSADIDTAYTHFAFCYAPTAIAAFERECRDFHELGGTNGLDNPRHPEPPQGSPWACPMRD